MNSSTSSKVVETMKPMLIKAGIALTLSLGAFVYARIVSNSKNSISETIVDSFVTNAQEEILGLRARIEHLREREWELETWVTRTYIDLKIMNAARIDLLDYKLSLIEDDHIQRVEKLVMECLRVLETNEYWKSESGLLRRQVKKLSRRVKVQSAIILERDSKIRVKESQVSRAREAMEAKSCVVKRLEDEVSELRIVLHRLEEEKNEVLNKLELEQRSTFLFSKVCISLHCRSNKIVVS